MITAIVLIFLLVFMIWPESQLKLEIVLSETSAQALLPHISNRSPLSRRRGETVPDLAATQTTAMTTADRGLMRVFPRTHHRVPQAVISYRNSCHYIPNKH